MAIASLLNEAQQRRLRANAQYADKLLSDIEAVLVAAESKSIFPKYRPDVSPFEAKLVRDSILRFRDQLARALDGLAVARTGPTLGSIHSIRVTLTFVLIAVQEMAPQYLQGYGEMPDGVAPQLHGVCAELEGLLERLSAALAENPTADFRARLARLEQNGGGVEALRILEQIIASCGLVELRPRLSMIMDRLESHRFEIAVFGRVSSGKSSLLNGLLQTAVLPVGVNPITAVPTRLVFGPEPLLTVTFAGRPVERLPIHRLPDFVSELHNPANHKGIVRLVVDLPSDRLKSGLGFVDTPGLGSLATAGAAETRAYLPQCDLGVVLVSAASPLNDEDISTVRLLLASAIPVHVLLSKADLLSPADLESALSYTAGQLHEQLGAEIDVFPVSTAASHSDLLDQWFAAEIAPLYEKHQQLAQASNRRKTGALREAVKAALEAKLTSSPSARVASKDEILALERDLRAAAGKLEEAREYCLRASDAIRALAPLALDEAAAALLALRTHPRENGDQTGAVVTGAIVKAAGAATEMHERLTVLAHGLWEALQRTAQALDRPDTTDEADFLRALPELPRFDPPPVNPVIPRPWIQFPRALARMRIRNRLHAALGQPLDEAFATHARLVEAWARKALPELQLVFDSAADAYRSQLAALVARNSVPVDEQAAIRENLARLAAPTCL